MAREETEMEDRLKGFHKYVQKTVICLGRGIRSQGASIWIAFPSLKTQAWIELDGC